MADYGIKVSKDGVDVKTATILNQSFNSEKNCLKIGLNGSLSSNATGDRTLTVAHSLAVTPAFMVWWQIDGGKWYLIEEIESVSGKSGKVDAWTDNTNLNIKFYSNGVGNMRAYYLIFVDPGT